MFLHKKSFLYTYFFHQNILFTKKKENKEKYEKKEKKEK